MKANIGLAQIIQETCCFNPVLTRVDDFRQFGLVTGQAVLDGYGAIDEIGGFVKGLNESGRRDVNMVGLIRALAWPSGPLANATLESLTKMLVSALKAQPIDGLLFGLHGAVMSGKELDATASLLETARRELGSSVPIVATFDLHANITDRILRAADVIIGYKTAPHLDKIDTGAKAAAILLDIMDRKKRPTVYHCKLPMLTPTELQNTFSGPIASLFREADQLSRSPGIIDVSIFTTQPWIDMPQAGWSILVTTEAGCDQAKEIAETLADGCWRLRKKMDASRFKPSLAIRKALNMKGGPVIIADGADATNSGATGDSTHLVKAILSRRIPGGALAFMVDPQAVKIAKGLGVGKMFEALIGGKRDNIFSSPIEFRGEILALKPVRFTLAGHCGNSQVDMGMAAIVKGRDLTLLLLSRTGPGSTPLVYRSVGLEPADYKIVVVKSPAGFRADYAPISKKVILSDCPGCALPHFKKLPFRRLSRPLWPLDNLTDRRSSTWANDMTGFKSESRPATNGL